MPLTDVRHEVQNMLGGTPSVKAVWSAVQMVERVRRSQQVPQSRYSNCGRHRKVSEEQAKAVVQFVRTWRHKRFCTCNYIRQVLKLKVHKRTIANVLNRAGYKWRALPKVRGLSDTELAKRKAFVTAHIGKSAGWWHDHMQLVFDGVTLTMAPKPLTARARHMAQSVKHTWVREDEKLDNDSHHHNRYGIQLGVKVPLWGGFTGGGRFALKEWTPRPKMTKEEWAPRILACKRAIDKAGESRATIRAKVWHDNEKFLLQPAVYKKHGLQSMRFPPNSGDLNPIETVWAWLRRDLALREQEDFDAKRVLTKAKFRQRVSQILRSYEEAPSGQTSSRLQKLVRGMPARLAKCRANRYGRCGK